MKKEDRHPCLSSEQVGFSDKKFALLGRVFTCDCFVPETKARNLHESDKEQRNPTITTKLARSGYSLLGDFC